MNIRRIQQFLKDKGQDIKVDGLLGVNTKNAALNYIRTLITPIATVPFAPIPKPVPDSSITIDDKGWIVGVKRDVISGGTDFINPPMFVVEHFTGGSSVESSINEMKNRGVSAHVVIDRDGTITQCRSFLQRCDHAGRPGKARWKHPITGKLYDGCNSCSIGIEIANLGDDKDSMDSYRNKPYFRSIRAKHFNESVIKEWESYYEPQMKSVIELTKALVSKYKLVDVTGHENVAPERKNDPGPAFDMLAVRKACGFDGLPVVHRL